MLGGKHPIGASSRRTGNRNSSGPSPVRCLTTLVRTPNAALSAASKNTSVGKNWLRDENMPPNKLITGHPHSRIGFEGIGGRVSLYASGTRGSVGGGGIEGHVKSGHLTRTISQSAGGVLRVGQIKSATQFGLGGGIAATLHRIPLRS